MTQELFTVYRVQFRAKDGNVRTRYFVPVDAGYMSLSYVHICKDAKTQAYKFVEQVSWSDAVLIETEQWEGRN